MAETVQVSYCTVCDALPGECEHEGAARYLDDVKYEPVTNAKGEQTGWKIPDAERDDWERRLARITGGDLPKDDAPPPPKPPKPVQRLIVEMEAWFALDHDVERAFRAYYDEDAAHAERLADRVIAGARNRSLTSPAGFLMSRLRKLDAG